MCHPNRSPPLILARSFELRVVDVFPSSAANMYSRADHPHIVNVFAMDSTMSRMPILMEAGIGTLWTVLLSSRSDMTANVRQVCVFWVGVVGGVA